MISLRTAPCAESSPGFPSLIEGLARTKVHSDGSFVKRGHFTHGPDGLRHLAWRFLPRPKPRALPPLDINVLELFAGSRYSTATDERRLRNPHVIPEGTVLVVSAPTLREFTPIQSR